MNVDKEKVNAIVEYLNQEERYSFASFIQAKGMMTEVKMQQDNMVIPCFFHEDESPSCSFNDRIHGYHCLSCGRHGNYLSFRTEYALTVEGARATKYSVANRLLAEDQMMQARLGFSTIYMIENLYALPTEFKKAIRPVVGKSGPTTYSELSSELSKKKLSIEKIKTFILMMQDGVSPFDIWKEFTEEQGIQEEESKPAVKFDFLQYVEG